MHRWLLYFALALACGAIRAQTGDAAPEPIRFARHPSLSPDGSTTAFSYAGDIWTVPATGGTARRLTVHKAFDQFPVWSPDGKWIAFSSDREGSYDVCIMPAEGGEPRRLTYHSAADYVTDWTPNGSEILFTSARETTRTSAVYAVNVQTGRSRLVRSDEIALANARSSPDGRVIYCTRGGSWTRKGYRGSGASDLLAVPSSGGAGQFLTHTETNERWAMPEPDGRFVCYVSDRSGTPNIVRRRVVGGAETLLTRFTDGNVFYPSMARDGSRIAFERDFGIWTLDMKTREAHEIPIYAPTDYRVVPEDRRRLGSRIQEFALAPDGKQVAFVVHGEIFVVTTTGRSEPRRITDTPQREEDIAWSPDARYLAMVSDRTGEAELYLVDIQDLKVRVLTDAPAQPPAGPVFSPDGKSIAFVRGASGSELCVVPAAGGPVRVLVKDPSIEGPVWSPNGQWIAYARHKSHSAGSVADIFLVNVEKPQPINITRYPAVSTRPSWSPDGRRIFFLSNRGQTNHVWSVSLREEAGTPEGSAEAPSEPGSAGFDLDRIHLQARRVTSGDSSVQSYVLAPDGRSVLFTVAQLDRTDIWRVAVAGGAPTRLTQSGESASSLQMTRDGSVVYYTVGGALRRLVLAGPSPTVQPLPVSVDIVLNRRAEMLQMFDEAWRKMRDGFYDPGMHGCDWNSVRSRYRPIAERLQTREEFYALFTLALGELNASHCGISSPDGGASAQGASLGVVLDDAYPGPGVRIARVMRRGPADRPGSRLAAGDVLVNLDGADIASNEEFHGMLEGRAGKQVALSVRSKDGKDRTVRIRPVATSAIRELVYDEWVHDRKQLVERLSGGRLQYVHLSGMGAANLETFRRAALSEMEGKEGLILDVRFNGGGSIADEIFSVLENRVFGWRTIRGDPQMSPAPLPALARPIIVLANEASFSNAEVFPWGLRALKLGKVVGVRTFGGVIGTGSTTLIDGTTLRMPAVGSYTLDGRNMENNGCPPDIFVQHTPEDIVSGRDRQLERAVSELLRQIGKRPPARRSRVGRGATGHTAAEQP